MKLTKQSQSRLEESKVEKRIEDEEYLANHQEIAAAIRVISKSLLQEQPSQPIDQVIKIVLDTNFEENVKKEKTKMTKHI